MRSQTDHPSAGRSPRFARVWVGAVAFVVVVGAAAWGVRFGGDNLREVVPGEVLRSGQPRADDLARLVRRRGLRTVLNLRTSGVHHEWLEAETAACSTLGIDLYSIGFDPSEWPRQSRVRELVRVLDGARRPILLHCRRGIDRAGWAAAVVRILGGEPPRRALSELDLWHGHLCDRATCPLHRFFASYESYLERSGIVHSAATFRHWALQLYCPEPYHAEIRLDERLPAAVGAGAPLKVVARVRNHGRDGWEMGAGPGGVRLGVRAIGPFESPPPDPASALSSGRAAALDLARADGEPGELPPGGERRFEVRFTGPREPGLYVLQVDMVREQVHWFSDLGGPGVLQTVCVTPMADTED